MSADGATPSQESQKRGEKRRERPLTTSQLSMSTDRATPSQESQSRLRYSSPQLPRRTRKVSFACEHLDTHGSEQLVAICNHCGKRVQIDKKGGTRTTALQNHAHVLASKVPSKQVATLTPPPISQTTSQAFKQLTLQESLMQKIMW